MISIVIVDDHPILVSGMRMLIEAQKDMKVVGEANEEAAALKTIEKTMPDVILLDISLGNDSNGLDMIPSIKNISPGSKILILTMHEDRYFFEKALETGVKGFLIKKAIDVDLIYAINVVSRNETYIYHSLVDKIIHDKNEDAKNKSKEELLWETLSEREKQVMTSIAHGLTNKEIANKYSLSEKTVGTYRIRGFAKLGFTSKTELVDFIFKKIHK